MTNQQYITEQCQKILSVFDGGTLGIILATKILSSQSSIDFFAIRGQLEKYFENKLYEDIEPIFDVIRKYFESFIGGKDFSKLNFENYRNYKPYYNGSLVIEFGNILGKKKYDFIIEDERLAQFKKLKETTKLTPNSNTILTDDNLLVNDIRYLIVLLKLLKEPLNVNTITFQYLENEKQKIAISPNMFESIFKIILRVNEINL